MKIKNKPGFSLIELLIGLAMFAVVIAGIVVSLATVFKGSRKTNAIELANSEGAYALRAMEQMIKYARTIQCQSGNNALLVTRVNNEVVRYYLDTATNPDRIASQGAYSTYGLTTSNVVAAACSGGSMFSCNGTNSSVSICFTVESNSGTDVQTWAGSGGTGVRFSSEVYLRNWGN